MINVTMNKEIMLTPDELIHEVKCLSGGNKVLFFRELIDFICENPKHLSMLCHCDWYDTKEIDWLNSKEKLLRILNTDYSQECKDNFFISTLGMDLENIQKW